MESIFIPDALIDHILTGELMSDPVIAEDNRTYDREAIESWISSKKTNSQILTSPLTREPMGAILRPNIDLKRAIDELQSEISRRRQQTTLHEAPSVESTSSYDIHIEDTSEMKSIHDLGSFFSCFDSCREILAATLTDWTPPCVMVMGAENTGKSTVLERLALMSIFPRSEGICTRIPIHARLRRTLEAKAPVLTIYNQATRSEERRMVIPLQSGHVDVREAMEEIIKTQRGSISGVESQRIIILHICSPRVPSIDLIDLPGIVVGAVAGEPSEMADLTHNLVLSHINLYGDRAIYLTISRATQATNKDVGFGILQERALEV